MEGGPQQDAALPRFFIDGAGVVQAGRGGLFEQNAFARAQALFCDVGMGSRRHGDEHGVRIALAQEGGKPRMNGDVYAGARLRRPIAGCGEAEKVGKGIQRAQLYGGDRAQPDDPQFMRRHLQTSR